jgi:flagellum-specific ATP synthase
MKKWVEQHTLLPPSVFSLLPNLIERAGVGKNGKGSITAVYTVLAENDDNTDPIVDIARASLDGQVILSRNLADSAHYPAIDLHGSISRVMQNLVDETTHQLAAKFRRLWSLYQQNEDLIKVGAYKNGVNPELDEAIRLREAMVDFLQQGMINPLDFKSCINNMKEIMNLKSNSNIINNSLTSDQTKNKEKGIKDKQLNDDKLTKESSKKVGATPFSAENRLIQ